MSTRSSPRGGFLRIAASLRALLRIAAAPAAAVLLAGCETLGYYAQAINGHLVLMVLAQPVESVIADPATPQVLRARLALARSIRDYAARELKLPGGGRHRS